MLNYPWALAGAVALMMAAGGCVKVVDRKVARFSNGAEPTTQPVPESGAYKVKVARRGEDDYRKVPGTWMLLREGQPVGFRVDERGTVYATAGQQAIALDLPADWSRLMWHTSHEEQTQFAQELREGTAATAKAAGAAAGALGGAVVEGMLEDDPRTDFEKAHERAGERKRELERERELRQGRNRDR